MPVVPHPLIDAVRRFVAAEVIAVAATLEHTEEVLGGALGYPPARLSALRASGALGEATTTPSPSAT